MDTIHQELHDFLHSPRRLMVAVGVLLFGSVIVAQWLYPSNRTMPFAVVDGEEMGVVSREELLGRLRERYEEKTAFLAGKEVIAESKLSDIGIIPNYEITVERALAYPWWERMIPFSVLTRQWSMGEVPMTLTRDKARIEAFVTDHILPRCNREAVSARITVKKGTLLLAEGSEGRYCDKQALIKALSSVQPQNPRKISLPYESLYPQRKTQEVKALFNQTKHRFSDGIAIEVDGTVHRIPGRDVISWFIFDEDKKTHALKLAVNDGRLRHYLLNFRKKFYKPPTARTVYLLDGAEQRQRAGAEGRTIDIAATQTAVKKILLGSGGVARASMQTVVPQTIYVNDYSLSSRGLQSLLQNLAREKGGYGLSVIELDGRGRVANANGNQSFTTASTYKIFVAYSVLKEIEAGRITWGQHIRNGMNTEACWEEMLIYSMNPCSWTFADMVGGWGRIEQQARSYGLANTYLNASDKRSTANDEALFFAKLERGELLRGTSRQKLLDTFKAQHYRSGIPAGTGLVVANKIGFLEGYLHDIGIVYAPKGRYVLAVMTNGGSWGGIADVARRVNEYMQR